MVTVPQRSAQMSSGGRTAPARTSPVPVNRPLPAPAARAAWRRHGVDRATAPNGRAGVGNPTPARPFLDQLLAQLLAKNSVAFDQFKPAAAGASTVADEPLATVAAVASKATERSAPSV